jgi:hypothetical protein
MEEKGIDPFASCLQSRRSTIWATPPSVENGLEQNSIQYSWSLDLIMDQESLTTKSCSTSGDEVDSHFLLQTALASQQIHPGASMQCLFHWIGCIAPGKTTHAATSVVEDLYRARTKSARNIREWNKANLSIKLYIDLPPKIRKKNYRLGAVERHIAHCGCS